MKDVENFWKFVEAGRRLGALHINFENIEPYPVTVKQGDLRTAVIKDPSDFYQVAKMKFLGKRGNEDKTSVIYNSNITIEGIPLEAFDYVVNGKSALEWVMERQVRKTDSKSGLVNDANRYALETMDNPSYSLELFQRVIAVSLETMKIVRSLPKLHIATAKGTAKDVRTLEDIQNGIKSYWGNIPAATYALRIMDSITEAKLGSGHVLRVSDIVQMLDAKELSGDLISAMAILVQSEFAIFRAGGEFVDEYNIKHELSPDDFQRVLDLDTVLHPLTQDDVAKASEKVVPFFALETDIFGEDTE